MNFKQFLLEAVQKQDNQIKAIAATIDAKSNSASKLKKPDTFKVKDDTPYKKDSEKKKEIDYTSMDKTKAISLLKKELYDMVFKRGTAKYVNKEKLEKLKDEGATDDDLAKFTELQADEIVFYTLAVTETQTLMRSIAKGLEQLEAKIEGIIFSVTQNANRAVDEYYKELFKKQEKEIRDKKEESDDKNDKENKEPEE